MTCIIRFGGGIIASVVGEKGVDNVPAASITADEHVSDLPLICPFLTPPCLRQSQEWSNEFNDFIRQCLIKDFETRPTCINTISRYLCYEWMS